MSRLSPDSLFHFTPTLANLLGILKNTFYPRYCYEKFDLIDGDSQYYSQFIENALPMVCFCDTPLSQLMEHITRYGKYGLGMSKTWGIKRRLNPVIYFNKNSHLAERINTATDELIGSQHLGAKAFFETHCYMKPYEGDLYRGGRRVKEKIRLYDEHEWRYVPSNEIMQKYNIQAFLYGHTYMDLGELKKANRKLEIDQIKLSFNPNDIKYVIIKDESEINNMVTSLKDIKGSKGYDNNTLDRLTSRIITVKQIKADF